VVTIYQSKSEENEILIENEGETVQTFEHRQSIDQSFAQTATPPPDSKTVGKQDLSDNILTFLDNYQKDLKLNLSESNIQVSAVLGNIARLYERLRTLIEYKGEHVLRRNAIERILRRLVWEKESIKNSVDSKKISENLIRELVWVRYLANNSIPSSRISEVAKIIDKYFFLLKNLDNLPTGLSLSKVKKWLWGVASSEIEDLIDPSKKDLYINLMLDWFNSNFDWKDKGLSPKKREIQIYLAIHRSLVKSDEAIMRYYLLMKSFPGWGRSNEEDLYIFINNFPEIFKNIENDLNYPGRYYIFRKIQKHSPAFEIFRLITEKNSEIESLISDRKKLNSSIKRVCEETYKKLKVKVNKGIIRSIFYIFLTKVLFAFLLEIPYEIYRFGDVRYTPLFINIALPPFMMWLISFSITVPGAKNTQLIIEKINTVIYKSENPVRYQFSIGKNKGNPWLISIFGIFYTLLFFSVFGGISFLLFKLNFSISGILVFFVFLSLVILFAFRIRYHASQLKVESEKEGFFSHLIGYLSLPFLNFGFYLSKGLSALNFFTVFLDFIIEAPLKNIIEIFEEWTLFIREKKEEVIEVPE